MSWYIRPSWKWRGLWLSLYTKYCKKSSLRYQTPYDNINGKETKIKMLDLEELMIGNCKSMLPPYHPYLSPDQILSIPILSKHAMVSVPFDPHLWWQTGAGSNVVSYCLQACINVHRKTVICFSPWSSSCVKHFSGPLQLRKTDHLPGP